MDGQRWNDELYDDQEADPDAPQPCDLERDDGAYETVDCPNCGANVSELSERCPACGDWIVPGSHRRRSLGFVVIAVLLLASFLAWVLVR